MPYNISFLYLSTYINTPEFEPLVLKIYEIIKSKDYNNFNNWFFKKAIPGVINGCREIILCCINHKIIGVSVLKNTQNEKKICTLLVIENFRKNGIGTLLIDKSFEYLGTTKPLVTINEHQIPFFSKIIKKYKWQQTQILEVGYYNNYSKEIVFNGTIT